MQKAYHLTQIRNRSSSLWCLNLPHFTDNSTDSNWNEKFIHWQNITVTNCNDKYGLASPGKVHQRVRAAMTLNVDSGPLVKTTKIGPELMETLVFYASKDAPTRISKFEIHREISQGEGRVGQWINKTVGKERMT